MCGRLFILSEGVRMNTIWKYHVPIEDNFTIEMPFNSKILSFQLQKTTLTIWCLVDTDRPLNKRQFRLCGTGHELENRWWKFIGTVQILNGDIVYHLFEKEVI